MNITFGKQLKMKYCKIFFFLILMIMDVSTNAQEVTCEAEQLINVDILMGHPGTAPPYKPGHILVFRCTDVNLKMYGQRAIECLSNGKWDYPYPKCEEVTCEAEQLINVDILIGHPGTVPPYKPGHILVFRCTDVSLKMHGQQTIECLSNGKWNHPYPKCEELTCNLNTRESNIKMERFPDFECPVKPGYNVIFSCNGQGLILKGQKEITCQSNGEWSSPFPTCEVTTVKCGRPPHVNDADLMDMIKTEYNTGERVQYSCFSKYTLDQRPPFSNYLTCQQGQWSGNIKCLKPCTVTKQMMDERGIELAFRDDQKMFVQHDDHITFKCQLGKHSRSTAFRQQCNDGEMTLPLCV
ncbi:complement factor H-related protein 2-like isoform X4 [Labeo rohita]|uniref:complement factor H-related protein 2-like isoform X3 n=1 Tax=Labeo rohita TaxID=84645 RepID=UPI0021E27C93|nr:complement factor H-related protein 2-like isoform X3 [Labeo rohita]XP_050950053.1 complement factor H-related protein 2-like isoform X4 [Labeo rohita]